MSQILLYILAHPGRQTAKSAQAPLRINYVNNACLIPEQPHNLKKAAKRAAWQPGTLPFENINHFLLLDEDCGAVYNAFSRPLAEDRKKLSFLLRYYNEKHKNAVSLVCDGIFIFFTLSL